MFDLGWTELLLIGIVALIVVGPKDLPGMFRTLGRFTGKMRNMAREFSRAMNEAADDAGVKDVKDIASGLRDATSPAKMGLDRLNQAADKFEAWDPAGTAKKKPPQTASEAAGLSEDRAEAAKKIHEYTAEKARAAREAEAAEAVEDDPGMVAAAPTPKPKPAPAKAKTSAPAKKKPPAKPRAKPAAPSGAAAKPVKPAAKSAAGAKTTKPRSTKPKPASGNDTP